MSLELAPLRAQGGGGTTSIDSSTAAIAQSPLTHRPVLRRTLQFAGVVALLVAAAVALSAWATPTPTPTPTPSAALGACRWPAPLAYSLLLRLDDAGGAALDRTRRRFRAHSTAVMAVEARDQEEEACVLLHASPELAFESIGASVLLAPGGGGGGGSIGGGWRDMGILCGPGVRDCAGVVVRGAGGEGKDRIGVVLPAGALVGTTTTITTVRLRFTYTGGVGSSSDQLGLWRSPAGQRPLLLSTQLEPDGARRLLPCVDAPSAKATFEAAVALPAPSSDSDSEEGAQYRWSALSNGRARGAEGGELVWLDDATGEEVVVSGEQERAAAADATARSGTAHARLVRFAPTPVMSPYLLAVAAGDLECTAPLLVLPPSSRSSATATTTTTTAVRVCSARGRAAAVAREAGGGGEGDSKEASPLAPARAMAASALAHYARLTGVPYGGFIYPPSSAPAAAAAGSGGNGTTTKTTTATSTAVSSKLDVLLVPGKGGAMENLGLPIFDEARLLLPPLDGSASFAAADANANENANENASSSSASSLAPGAWALWRAADVLCHEVAHMWAGDLATAASWRDLAANEGAATLLEYGCVGEALFAAASAAAAAALSPPPRSSSSSLPWAQRLAIAAATFWAAPPAIPGLSPGVHEGAVAKARAADASPLAPALLAAAAGAAAAGEEGGVTEDPTADFGPVTYSKGAALLGMLSALGEQQEDEAEGGGFGGRGGGGAAAAALVPPDEEGGNDGDNNGPPRLLPPFSRALSRYLRERAFGVLTLRGAAVGFLLPFAPPPLGIGPAAAARLYARAEAGGARVGDGRTGRRRAALGVSQDDDDAGAAAAGGGDGSSRPPAAATAADAFFRSWAERPGRPVVGVSVEASAAGAGASSSSSAAAPQLRLRVRQARLCAWGLLAAKKEEEAFALECPGSSGDEEDGGWWLAMSAGPIGGGGGGRWLLLPPAPAAGGGGQEQQGAVVAPAPAFASAASFSNANSTTWSLHADGGLSGLYYAHHCDARHRAAVRAAAAADAVAAADALDSADSAADSAAAAAAAATAAVGRITRAAVLLRDAADVALSPPSLLPAWARAGGEGEAGGEQALAAALGAAGAAAAALGGGGSSERGGAHPSLGASLAAYSLLAGVALPVLRELDAQVWHLPSCRADLRAVARRALAPSVAAALLPPPPLSSSSTLAPTLLARMLAGPLLADAALVWRDPDVARKLCASVVVVRRGGGDGAAAAGAAAPVPLLASSLGPDAGAAALAAAAAAPPGCELASSLEGGLIPALERQAAEATAPLLSAEALFALAAAAGRRGGSGGGLDATLALALGLSRSTAEDYASARSPKAYSADLVVAAAQASVAGVGDKGEEEEQGAAAAPPLLGPAVAFLLDRWPEVVRSLGGEDAWALLVRLVRSAGGAAPTREGTERLARALKKAVGAADEVDNDGNRRHRRRAVLGAAASRAEWSAAHAPGLCAALGAAAAAAAEGE